MTELRWEEAEGEGPGTRLARIAFAVCRSAFRFSGRSSRFQFVRAVLWIAAIFWTVETVIELVPMPESLRGGLISCWALVMIVPWLAVAVRRLHDTGRGGLSIFVAVFPYVGWLILLVYLFLPGQRFENEHGRDPSLIYPPDDQP